MKKRKRTADQEERLQVVRARMMKRHRIRHEILTNVLEFIDAAEEALPPTMTHIAELVRELREA